MTAPTHVAFAEFVYLLILTTTGVALSLPNAAAVALASVLPDIDTGTSTVGRMFPVLSRRVERRFGHRTLTHSALFIAGMGVILLPFVAWDRDIYTCILAGYTTHPFLDTMTVNGVKLLHPVSSVRCVFPLEVNHPSRYRMRTGSRLDRLLGLIFLLGCIPTFFVASQGYERFVRFAQRNIESAVRDYNEFSRSNLVYAQISAHNLLTKEQITGRFEIVGALNNHTVLFKGADGRLHSLGNEYQSEYVAESALCDKGEVVRVVIQQIDMQNQPLGLVESFVDTAAECRFFGEFRTLDHFSAPQEGNVFSPITGSSGNLRLNYASVDDIRALGMGSVFIAAGTLTLRSIGSALTASPTRRPASYTRVGFDVDEKHPLELLCRKGDTVNASGLLARWGSALEVDSLLRLNVLKIAALGSEVSLKRSGLQEKLMRIREARTADSMSLVAIRTMEQSGFVTESEVRKAEARCRRSWFEMSGVQRSLELMHAKTAIGIGKLQLDNQKLLSRKKASGARSEARSPVRGVIEEIRQAEHNGKLLVAILIRGL